MFSLTEFRALPPARKAIIQTLLSGQSFPVSDEPTQQDIDDVLDLWHSSSEGECVPAGYEENLEANIIKKFADLCSIALDLAVERFTDFKVRGIVTVEPSYDDTTRVVYHDLYLPFCYGLFSRKAWHFNFETLGQLCEFIEEQRDSLLEVLENLNSNVKIGKLKLI